ncbi:unnamed protein product, partial [Meganyctiphanes norvegica]
MKGQPKICYTSTLLVGLSASTEIHNNLINSSTLEVNHPGSSTKYTKKKTHRAKDHLVIQTKSGLIRGIRKQVLGKDIDVFYGIPFAKPPLKELRFHKPVAMDPWKGILDATNLPNSCEQTPYEYYPGFEGEAIWNPNTPLSEDCLYLNIWAPAKLREEGELPGEILVWLYGGGFMAGTISLEIYDADIMAAANNVVVASMNYRVGSFGYLYLKELDILGNQGLYDQALAMKWIQDNAIAFGGNPNHITLFGESAGGGSVTAHLLSPISRNYFNRAILQSGVINCPWSIMTVEKAHTIGLQLVDDCGCNSSLIKESPKKVIACMQNVNASTINNMVWNSYWGILGFPTAPIVDGIFLPDDPMEMLKRGDYKDTELLIGTNKDEGTFFIIYDYMDDFSKDDSNFIKREKFLEIVNQIFKDFSQVEREAIIFQYTEWEHLEDGYYNQKALSELVADYFFICPSNLFAEMYAHHGRDVYYYHFTHRTSTNPWGEWMGVLHGDEVDYVFGHPLNKSKKYSREEEELSRKIMGYFTTFSATG